jgi:hypothetical protein
VYPGSKFAADDFADALLACVGEHQIEFMEI